MKTGKLLGGIFIFLLVSASVNALEQRKPTARKISAPPKELRDQRNIRNIPFPYPKTRDEIIADLNYAAKEHFGGIRIRIENADNRLVRLFAMIFNDAFWLYQRNKESLKNNMLVQLSVPTSGVHVGEIEKVANRTNYATEFFFCIVLKDKRENEAGRVSLDAAGSFIGGSFMSNSRQGFRRPLKSRAEALKEISLFTNPSEVTRAERIVMANSLASDPYFPTWEIETRDNSRYYLDENGHIFKLRKKMPDAKGRGLISLRRATKDEWIVYDWPRDQMLFLDILK